MRKYLMLSLIFSIVMLNLSAQSEPTVQKFTMYGKTYYIATEIGEMSYENAKYIENEFEYNGITNWKIPTKEEAELIIQAYELKKIQIENPSYKAYYFQGNVPTYTSENFYRKYHEGKDTKIKYGHDGTIVDDHGIFRVKFSSEKGEKGLSELKILYDKKSNVVVQNSRGKRSWFRSDAYVNEQAQLIGKIGDLEIFVLLISN